MSRSESYRLKSFKVSDPDARIRKPGQLLEFERANGDFVRIPKNTQVKVSEIKTVPGGSTRSIVFARAFSTDGSREYGWTSSRNFAGRFINETLGELAPKRGANRYGPNAAWSRGQYISQITLVSIVDVRLEIERIALKTLDAYLDVVDAAARDGVRVALTSGFRSYPEQKYLWDGWRRRLPGFNLAAKPGRSKHQNGIAFDISVAGANGDPTYEWLRDNATSHGFVRTVNGERWHWEYDVDKASRAAARGTYKTSNVRT